MISFRFSSATNQDWLSTPHASEDFRSKESISTIHHWASEPPELKIYSMFTLVAPPPAAGVNLIQISE
jgi:hypothetical protein